MKFTCMLMSVILMAICTNSAGAIEDYANQRDNLTKCAGYTSITNRKLSLYKDIIVRRHRVNSEGVEQYRHWNVTKQCWVEPDWIDMK